jgi:hypothetical protein
MTPVEEVPQYPRALLKTRRLPRRRRSQCGDLRSLPGRAMHPANAYLASKQVRLGWHMSREQRTSSGPKTVTVRAHQHELSDENSKCSTSSGSAW